VTRPHTSLIDRIGHWLDSLTAIFLAVMVVMVFGNVVLRYAFNSGIAVSEELSRWLFVWMTFIGAVVALKDHGHLGTDMLVARLSPAGRKVCLVISQLLMLGITGMIFTGSLAQTRINLDVEAPVTGASMALVYAAGLAFAVPAAFLLLRQLWRTLRGAGHDGEPS
jgi:TRAP-type transport system small permease protein